MKILILSLLRLGDILMHREILKSLRAQYPQAEIHFLINSQFSSVKDLLPEVQQWKFVPRNRIQQILVERRQDPHKAFSLLDNVVRDIQSEDYDLVVNATHNFFSVRLMDLIKAKEKKGVALSNGRKIPDQNRWQKYMNDNFSVEGQSRFHYIEVLQRSLNIPVSRPEAPFPSKSKKLVLLQLLTADTKKNWGLWNFHQLLKTLQRENPELSVFGLCSPDEREDVLKVFSAGDVLSPLLKDAAEMLRETRLLITGDTSLQHLAAQAGCQVLSLFLGSADVAKTAPWQKGAWVVRSGAACAPCRHSEPCHQKSHLCAEAIACDTVISLAHAVLMGTKVQPTSQVAQTFFSADHFFTTPEIFEKTLERTVWSCYLDEDFARYATIAREMGEVATADIDRTFRQQQRAQDHRAQIQSAVERAYTAVVNSAEASTRVQSQRAAIKNLVEKFELDCPHMKDSVLQFRWAVSRPLADFQFLKELRAALAELQELMRIRTEILKELRGQNVRTQQSTPSPEERPIETGKDHGRGFEDSRI